MDVFCVGMYRSCSTWQYEVAAHLVERHRQGERLGFLTALELIDLERRGSGPWRVVKSHEESRSVARALRAGTGRALYAHRDVREVVFSMLHKRGQSFDEFVGAGTLHQVMANDRFWRARPAVLVQRYDDLIARPVAGVAAIAEHLGIELATGETEALSEEYSREANRARALRLRDDLLAQGADLDDPSFRQACDPKTLLHWDHLRGRSAPTWRELAGPEQRAVLVRLCGDWLVANGYEDDTSWADAAGPVDRGRRWRVHATIAGAKLHSTLERASLRWPRASAWAKGRTKK